MDYPHGMYNACVLKTYEDTAKWFAKAKDPGKGRPFREWARVHRAVQEDLSFAYKVYVYDRHICTITPDNILTMEIDNHEGSRISNSLSASLFRLAPIAWQRAGMRRYRVLSLRSMKASDNYWQVCKTAPELFKGLQFDLTTGKALNAKPDRLTRVNTDARRQWLRALRKFRSGVTLRVRMGVFDAIQNEFNSNGTSRNYGTGKLFVSRAPNWTDPQWMDLLYTSIRDSQYPKELLAGILLTMPTVIWSHWHTLTQQEKVKRTIDHIINSNSIELRTRFGVFNDEVTSSEEAKQD